MMRHSASWNRVAVKSKTRVCALRDGEKHERSESVPRHPEVRALARLEGRRGPGRRHRGPSILRGSLRSHLRMTELALNTYLEKQMPDQRDDGEPGHRI